MVGVFHLCCDFPAISVFDVASGIHTHSHWLSGDIPLLSGIWACGESLRFITAGAATITIWEVGFAWGARPTELETIHAPDKYDSRLEVNDLKLAQGARLLPALSRLALAFWDRVLAWDFRSSKYLLHSIGARSHPTMTFSGGRFFACSTTGQNIHLWKESPVGYILYGALASDTLCSNSLLSPNGDSIVVLGGHTIRLWHTKGFTTTPFGTWTQTPQHTKNFLL